MRLFSSTDRVVGPLITKYTGAPMVCQGARSGQASQPEKIRSTSAQSCGSVILIARLAIPLEVHVIDGLLVKPLGNGMWSYGRHSCSRYVIERPGPSGRGQAGDNEGYRFRSHPSREEEPTTGCNSSLANAGAETPRSTSIAAGTSCHDYRAAIAMERHFFSFIRSSFFLLDTGYRAFLPIRTTL
jgi:hypothetical protein